MLYKYLSLAKDSKKYALENIEESILFFNVASNFNDPFDMNPSTKLTEDKANELKKEILDIYPHYKVYIQKLSKNYIKKMLDIRVIGGMLNNRYAVTCFTKNPRNILMWSHYGDKHRGICLGYNIDSTISREVLNNFIRKSNSTEYSDFFVAVKETEYSQSRPKLTQDDFVNIKSLEWGYEDEVRLVMRCPLDGKFPGTVSYDPVFLKEIIFGAMCRFDIFIEIINMLEQKTDLQVEVRIAILDEENFAIDVIPLSSEQIEKLRRIFRDLSSISKENMASFLKHAGLIKHSSKDMKQKWRKVFHEIPIMMVFNYFFEYSHLSLKTIIEKRRDNRKIEADEELYYALSLLYVKNMYNR